MTAEAARLIYDIDTHLVCLSEGTIVVCRRKYPITDRGEVFPYIGGRGNRIQGYWDVQAWGKTPLEVYRLLKE